jgi:hypothetical protein
MKREMKETAVDWFSNQSWKLKIQLENGEINLGEYAVTYVKLVDEAREMEKAQIMRAARLCHFEGARQGAKTGHGYADYAEQYYNETTTKPLTNLEISDRRLGLFLDWLIIHYNTASNSLMSYYTNSKNEEVSIGQILEHYNNEK